MPPKILDLPGLPPPSVRLTPSTWDPTKDIDGLYLKSCRLVAHLSVLVSELEETRMFDADPDREPQALSRITVLSHAAEVASTEANQLRDKLGDLKSIRADIEHLCSNLAGDTEGTLTLFVRELQRAPWDVPETRLALLGELGNASLDLARQIRSGLLAIVERMIRET